MFALTSASNPSMAQAIGGKMLWDIEYTGDAFEGYTLFDDTRIIGFVLAYTLDLTRNTSIVDIEGNLIKESSMAFAVEMFNSTTVLGQYGMDQAKLWNIYDGTEVLLDIPSHHELEYNAVNDTIFALEFNPIIEDNSVFLFDNINEYTMDGQLIWTLDTSEFISSDNWSGEYLASLRDMNHGNTIFFDQEEDIFYYNPRNLNTFYKIDHGTGEVLWALGQYGDFAMYDLNGDPSDSLFHHAHSVEQVDENTFILFDNEFYTGNELSRILEITIDEATMTANESWSWTAPSDYYAAYFGDADRLPNGNRLGTFGAMGSARIVEVNDAGEIVWELTLPTDAGVYRAERFRLSPILSTPQDILTISGNDVEVQWQAWYNFRPKRRMEGPYTLYLDDTEIDSGTVSFDKWWRPTNLTFSLGTLAEGNHNLTLWVEDGEGHATTDSLNITIGSYYIVRDGPQSIILDHEGNTIAWSGATLSPLFYNITVNSTLYAESMWTGATISVDLNILTVGKHNITLSLYNGTNLEYIDNFYVTVYPAGPPLITPSQPQELSLIWNETLKLSWELFGYLPFSWTVYLNGAVAASDLWPSENYLLNWTTPVLDEELYNLTVCVCNLPGGYAMSTTWLNVTSPNPPVIIPLTLETEFLWGQDNTLLAWEVHGGTHWNLWRNGTQMRSEALAGHLVVHVIGSWQEEFWRLGSYNVTLEVTDEHGIRTTHILWLQIVIVKGDAYANSIVPSLSQWYLLGENALGAPDGNYAQVFLDYGNGYLTLDMGLYEEIIDGPGADLQVVAQGANYTVSVTNSLQSPFKTLGHGNGTLEFDLTGSGVSMARYVRVQYRDGDTVELDAVVAYFYSHSVTDIENPLISGPSDFWVWANQTTISFTWNASDQTPWNYTILVNETPYELAPWNGSNITFNYSGAQVGTIVVTLILHDVCGNQAQDTVTIEIRPLPQSTPQLIMELGLIALAIGIIVTLLALLVWNLKKRRKEAFLE